MRRLTLIFMYYLLVCNIHCAQDQDQDTWDCKEPTSCAESFSKTLAKEKSKWSIFSEILKLWPGGGPSQQKIEQQFDDDKFAVGKKLSWFEVELNKIQAKQKILQAKWKLELEMQEESRKKWDDTLWEKIHSRMADWDTKLDLQDVEIFFQNPKSKSKFKKDK